MSDLRSLLERADRAVADVPLPADGFHGLERRRDRRIRNQRIGAAVMGLAIGLVAVWWGVQAIRSAPIPAERPDETPVAPRAAREVLWYAGEDGDLLAVDAVTSEERVLVDGSSPFGFRTATPSSDGQWVAFESWEGDSPALHVVGPELEPQKVAQLSDDRHLGSWAWSSTGALLAVHRVTHIDVIDPATGLVTESDPTFDAGAPPAWSPDGTRILLGAPGGTLHSIDTRTGEVTVLTQLPGDDLASTTAIAWSPDGSRLAVYSELDAGREEDFPPSGRLFVMDADGSNVRVLAEGVFLPGFDWSPDGSRLTFAESLDRLSRIWIAPIDGSTPSVVRTSAFRYANDNSTWGLPAWSPDGSQVAFSGEPNDAFVIDADVSGEPEPIDDLTYASWNGGSFCGMCLWWINHPVTYTGPSDA
jgi:Tol biopolymer transport system component